MPRKSTEIDRSLLLGDLSRLGGAAEYGASDQSELLRRHLPIADHWRVLDRDTLLVLGGRGVGKTQLFNVLNVLDHPESLVSETTSSARLRQQGLVYDKGFTLSGRTFPSTDVIEQNWRTDLLSDAGTFWLGLLAGVLLRRSDTSDVLKSRLGTTASDALADSLPAPSIWLRLIAERLETVRLAIDEADSLLERRGLTLTITYDDLDQLVARLPDAYSLIRDLLAFWLRGMRRWSSIRCKIFLRTDIFAAEEFAFTDSSKLRPLSVTLRWNADNLYRLVLKRLLNGDHGREWERFLRPEIPREKLTTVIPFRIVPNTGEEDHRAFMKLMVGHYMGSDKRRGETYRWFLNHLQDSRGDISPRSFLTLFQSAATRQLDEAPGERLLTPEQVSGALVEVSKDRLEELKEEYSWIAALAGDLEGRVVPMQRKDFRKCCRTIDWTQFPEFVRQNKDRLIDYLINLGILRETRDARIHVPDIYLFGLGLKRKGGIRRPKV
ncbi:MAG: hypothetical protein C4547_14730 [Phycisphaerales bacterium]|nr:MAG: hypothetical protein C4547_14730 [Phycisphaerales bacterium]